MDISDENRILLKPSTGFSLDLEELWNFRDLLIFLAWRDITVRYKQTLLGAAWAVLQPVMTMIVFSIIFGQLASIPSDGIPYPIFSFSALLPWQLFANGLNQSSNSLVGNANLLSKVYFPRIIIPLASLLPPVVDFLLAAIVLILMMIYFSIGLSIKILLLPVTILIVMFFAMGLGLWLSALNVQYRDIRFIVPFLSQFLMYLSPVVYPASLVPESWRVFYALNPMAGAIEGFRWALLGTEVDILPLILTSCVVTFVVLMSGIYYFRRIEKVFADVV